jgi:hypothetical protein
MEWRLVTDTGAQAMSPVAVAQLLGTPNLYNSTLAQAGAQQYLDYATPTNGLANLTDVFFSRNGWLVPGGGNAAASYSPTVTNSNGMVTGNAYALNIGPYTAKQYNYFYSVTPDSSLSPNGPDQPPPATGNLGTSLVAPLSGYAVIASGSYLTSPDGRFMLILQADGNLVLYDTQAAGQAIWSTQTSGKSGDELLFYSDGELELVTNNGSFLWYSYFHNNQSCDGVTQYNVLQVSDGGNAFTMHVMAPDSPYSAIIWSTLGYGGIGFGTAATASNWINLDQSLNQGSTLHPGQLLTPGEYLLSPNAEYALVMQTNSNLVLYDLGTTSLYPLWEQLNTNASYTFGQQPSTASMDSNGYFRIYSANSKETSDYIIASKVAGSYLTMQSDGNLVIYAPDGKAEWATNTVQS